MMWSKRSLVLSLSCSLVLAGAQAGGVPAAAQSAAPPPAQAAQPQPDQQSDAAQLDQLVAPIALYPDALVAQVLAASAYPDEVVEAERWMQQHSDLHGDALAQDVDKQSWDPSVKALTQFPSVLENMSKNLAWTSALGDAYVNQQSDVLDAVQAMRQRAQSAGNLKSTPQQTVTTEGQTIAIAPPSTQTVYVPQYDPWLVYGAPLAAYPGWAPFPGLYVNGPGISFGLGFGIGLFAGFGWGWNHWGANWHGHTLMHDHAAYRAHSRAFADRNQFFHGRADVGHAGLHGGSPRAAAAPRGIAAAPGPHSGALGGSGRGGVAGIHGGSPPEAAASHGVAAAHGGLHSGAFSGVGHGGVARAYSSRGRSSFGGGSHGGGLHAGGFHGGGSHGGGHGRR